MGPDHQPVNRQGSRCAPPLAQRRALPLSPARRTAGHCFTLGRGSVWPRDHILDNITLYWLTGTGASAARSYWEAGRAQALAAGQPPPQVSIPVGYTTFPGEIFGAPRSWVEQGYPTLTYFHEAAKGGHFAAWEEPGLFSEEIRAAFKSLR